MFLSEKIERIFKLFLPSPFTIAVILTLFTFFLALFITEPSTNESHVFKILSFWEKGIWEPSLLVFAMQMMLMLVLGHVLALSRPISSLINIATKYCNDTASSAAIITFFTLIVALFNWGLGLIFGAIFSRKVAERSSKKNIKINYPLIGACGYSGLMVWHGGISGSAPIKIAEEGHFLANKMGVISQSETIFSTMNISINMILIIILPIIMYLFGKFSSAKIINIQEEINQTKKNIEGAEKLDHSKIIAFLFGGTILFYCFYIAFILPNIPSLKIITPNYINLSLLGLCIVMHMNFSNFLLAVKKAISGTSGILIQFPLYFGIMGIMNHSGMVTIMSNFFVNIADETTFPIFTFISAGVVNIFVPSGGGQWAIQGPIIIDAAKQLGVDIPKSIMSLAYGDQITNMLQPFWALPLLGITGLKAKEILPYTTILFLIGVLVFIGGLLIF